MYNQIDFNTLKEKVHKQGCLYQYRPCSISEKTIYDLDNIRNEVLYARSPIHMNDPFDSTIAFDEKDVVNEIIDVYLEKEIMPPHIKMLIGLILKSRFLKTFPILIENLKLIKKRINVLIISRKWDKNQSFSNLYKTYIKIVDDYLTKELNGKFNKLEIVGMISLLDVLGNNEISEESILQIQGFNALIEDAEEKLKLFRETEFKEAIAKFQNQLTVTCLSASGWNNHLMWSHYTNSYKGICIEYDFSKMEECLGIIDNVSYKKERPKVKFRDLIPGDINFVKDESEKTVCVFDKNAKADINKILPHIFTKQDIWKYEEEWRIVNAENELDTHRFINVPFIKSVTYGHNIDPICKYMLVNVCKEKNIDLYEIVPSTIDYSLGRKLINKDEFAWSLNEQVKYIIFLIESFNYQIPKFNKKLNDLTEKMKKELFDAAKTIEMYESCLKLLSEIYFYKVTLNNILSSNPIVDGDETINNIVQINKAIDLFISETYKSTNDFTKSIETFYKFGLTTINEYYKLKNQGKDVLNLIDKINLITWLI